METEAAVVQRRSDTFQANEKLLARQREGAERESFSTKDKQQAVEDYNHHIKERADRFSPPKSLSSWCKEYRVDGKKVSANSLSTWLRAARTGDSFSHQRGKRQMLLGLEAKYVLDNVDALRAQGEPISTSTIIRAARDAVDLYRPGLQARNIAGRSFQFSKSWAHSFMRRHAYRQRKRTTDRTVSAEDIVKEGPQFFAAVAATNVKHPELKTCDLSYRELHQGAARWSRAA